MTNVWNLIKEWLALSAQKQLQAFLALILAISAYIVVHYERRLIDKESEIKELNKTHDKHNENNRIDLDNCNKNHIRYVEESEKEFKRMYFDVQNLKNK